MESVKDAAKFTAATATRIVSDNGAMCMNFEAGETRTVHKELFSAALRAGLVPEEGLETPPEPEVKVKRSKEELTSDGLLEACRTLIIRGDPKDFTVVGQPRAASIKKLVDFDFTANDIRRAFEAAMHEVETGGSGPADEGSPD